MMKRLHLSHGSHTIVLSHSILFTYANGKIPVENGTYVDMLLCGGMNPQAFSGVRRGQTLRTDCDQVIKKQGFMELYFNLAMTAHHGSQELGTREVNLMEDYNCCISIPLHKITEPPSYIAWKDSDDYNHPQERALQIRRLVPLLLGSYSCARDQMHLLQLL